MLNLDMVKFRQFLRRIINARYSVSSWLWILVSTATAAILLIIIATDQSPEVVDFLSKLPLNGFLWAGGLLISGLVKIYGMAFSKDLIVARGAMLAFCLWVFGLLTGNAVTVILLILPIMIFNAYMFLGATLRDGPQA